MTIVERVYPSFSWGSNLVVTLERDTLLVGFLPPHWKEGNPASDVLKEYRASLRRWTKKRTGKEGPHLRFANADTDEKLIVFVKDFGPVIVRKVRPELDPFVVEQSMGELRRERDIYRACMELTVELNETTFNSDRLARYLQAVATGIAEWPREWEREGRLRRMWLREEDREADWSLSKSSARGIQKLARQIGRRSLSEARMEVHDILCELINAFPSKVYRWEDKTFEGPRPANVRFFGIRPLLYYILRLVYLEKDHVSMCANEQCRELFEIERQGQRFCSAGCSQHQRQRDYWVKKGKKLRKQRLRRNP